MVMDGDWHEERPTLIDSSGWALNPECYYLNYLNYLNGRDYITKLWVQGFQFVSELPIWDGGHCFLP